jgi:ribosomal protein S18 acetylase RimI-like enzyme
MVFNSSLGVNQIAVPASEYDFEQLAVIYNAARVDYIVPMPMNARRMEDYVRDYDINLDASVVALNEDGEPTGVGMLGLRDTRGWITRLGVIPNQRRQKSGEFIMRTLLAQAQMRGAQHIQLEVIQGNDPAYRLFLKLGFETTRELLVIRRPPSTPKDSPPEAVLTVLAHDDILHCLEQRSSEATWIEETPSLLNAGSLKGLRVELASGQGGWIVFQSTLFQMTHFVYLAPDDDVLYALLCWLHTQYPRQDTKLENIPADKIPWSVFQSLGYVEAFRRIEMILHFR